MENQRRTDTKPVILPRLCTIFEGKYKIGDWYKHVKNETLTCVIQIDSNEFRDTGSRIKLPSYLLLAKDITDLQEYSAKSLPRELRCYSSINFQ